MTRSPYPSRFFLFAAAVLLVFTSLSSPTWENISFLNLAEGYSFGVFGYTASDISIGWHFTPTLQRQYGLTDRVFHQLTYALVLIPMATGFAGAAFLLALCHAGAIFSIILSVLAWVMTLVAWIVEMVLFCIARDRILNHGGNASLGNANWLLLGALVSLSVGVVTGIIGFRSSRQYSGAFY